MRTAIGVALILGAIGLSPAASAMPIASPPATAGAAPLVLVRGGCGPGWHPGWFRDRWGRRAWGCVPNGRDWPPRRYWGPGYYR